MHTHGAWNRLENEYKVRTNKVISVLIVPKPANQSKFGSLKTTKDGTYHRISFVAISSIFSMQVIFFSETALTDSFNSNS